MKKLLILGMVFSLSALLVPAAVSAHQDNSFTYTATSGMFEDMYDFFKYSPAYLPSFEKNSFWSQLSNLESQNDRLFNDSGTDYYLIGGQHDLMGFGRAGVMFDWYGYAEPEYLTDFAGYSGYGFVEDSWREYRDNDSNGVYDHLRELYGHGEEYYRFNSNDVYVAYGMGDIAGLALGAAVRGIWESSDPSYYWNNPYDSNRGSFDWVGWEVETDLLTGQRTHTVNEDGTGSWSYGESQWQLILGARAEDLMGMMPDLDVVLNVYPILASAGNDLEWNFTRSEDFSPAIPNSNTDVWSYSVTGFDYSSGPYPASGFGVGANLRVDYPLDPGVLMTGWINFETLGLTSQDANQKQVFNETERYPNGIYTQVDTTNQEINRIYDGKGSQNLVGAKVRFQFPANGWRLGVGINASTSDMRTEDMQYEYNYRNTFRRQFGQGDPTADYTEVTTNSTKYKYTEIYTTDMLELPVGIILDVLKNLSLQMGAVHVIEADGYSYKMGDREDVYQNTVRTYDNGMQTTSINTSDSNDAASQESYVAVDHYNYFTFGATWWPFEQVQIDLQAFNHLVELGTYRISVNIYY